MGSTNSVNQIESSAFLASSYIDDATNMTGELDVKGFGKLMFSVETDADGTSTFTAVPLNPESSLPELFHPNSGTALMSGNWAIAYAVDDLRFGNEGDVQLVLDFSKGTLTGSGDGLILEGQFSNGILLGLARFNGASARLEGVVGSDESMGFFVGPNFAGAFSVSN